MKPGRRRRAGHTIRDIAQLAGVSRSTVSLALNDSPRINKQTKARVLKIIADVGYSPNQVARNLVRQKSNTVLVVLPPISHVFADSYFSESLSGILDAATARHFHMMVEVATEEFKRENQAHHLYRTGSIDGVLCVGALTTDSYLEELHAAGCPVVLVNSALANIPNVIGSNEQAAYRVVKHLASLGHRRIGLIKGSEQVTAANDRAAGFRRGMEELGFDLPEQNVAQAFFGRRSGAQAMRRLLEAAPRPTAVFATNDLMALGAMEAIAEAGLRVPEDIAVFGGDDILLGAHSIPALSTLDQDMYAMGQSSLELLIKFLEGQKVYQPTVQVNVRMVVRESCGAKLQLAQIG